MVMVLPSKYGASDCRLQPATAISMSAASAKRAFIVPLLGPVGRMILRMRVPSKASVAPARSAHDDRRLALRAGVDPADAVRGLAGGAQQALSLVGVGRGHDQRHADAAVEHAQHLVVGDVALL